MRSHRPMFKFLGHLSLAAWIALGIGLLPFSEADSSAIDKELIGWLGETYTGGAAAHAASGKQNDPSGMRVLSWDPRIMHYRRFLTDEECDYLIKTAEPQLTRSGVSNAVTGADEVDPVRTSWGMFFSRGQTEVVRRIEERMARWTMLHVKNGEGIQVLRYGRTQEYRPHNDYFSFASRDDNGGNRMATILCYLADVEEGGETVFPKVPSPPNQDPTMSECGRKGLAVRPRKGDAILFWSIKPNGVFDPKSQHASCPVMKGVKWSATKWIHVGHFSDGVEKPERVTRVIYAPPPPPIPPGCKDSNEQCASWAEEGECEANPGYMVGTAANPGACLRSCNRCDLMPKHGAAATR